MPRKKCDKNTITNDLKISSLYETDQRNTHAHTHTYTWNAYVHTDAHAAKGDPVTRPTCILNSNEPFYETDSVDYDTSVNIMVCSGYIWCR